MSETVCDEEDPHYFEAGADDPEECDVCGESEGALVHLPSEDEWAADATS